MGELSKITGDKTNIQKSFMTLLAMKNQKQNLNKTVSFTITPKYIYFELNLTKRV